MPELPEVEAVCRNLRRDALGAAIVHLRVERPSTARPQDPAMLEREAAGRTIDAVERRGKNILLHLSGARVLHVHLRMTGNLYVIPDVRFRPAASRLWMELEGGKGLIFEDSRVLGKVHLHPNSDLEKVLKDVGVEPLSDAFTFDYFRRVAKASGQPSKIFLMDQRRVAGLGNIYAAEVLFRAGVNPRKAACALSTPKITKLYGAIVEVLHEAVESAASAYSEPGRFSEGESFPCAVYDREGEPCLHCGRAIKRIPQGGRSTYYCPQCQR